MEKKVSGYTEYESEDEVILRMGSQFRVKSDILELSNGVHIVHLIEINDDDDEDDEPLAAAVSKLNVTPKPTNKGIASETNFSFILFLVGQNENISVDYLN